MSEPSPAPAHRIVGLHWSDHQRPTNDIPYDHIIAETPFGRVLITWKGWKEHDTPTIDEFPGGGFLSHGWDIDNAKRIAESEWLRRVSLCLLPNREVTNHQAILDPKVSEVAKLLEQAMTKVLVDILREDTGDLTTRSEKYSQSTAIDISAVISSTRIPEIKAQVTGALVEVMALVIAHMDFNPHELSHRHAARILKECI